MKKLVFVCMLLLLGVGTAVAQNPNPTPFPNPTPEDLAWYTCVNSGPHTPGLYLKCDQEKLAMRRQEMMAYAPPPPVTYQAYGYSSTYAGYGNGYGYGYPNPEPCKYFPSNRNYVMGNIKIDLKGMQDTLKSALKDRGLPDTSEVDMYVAPVDETTGETTAILTLEGPVSKHNNWFNNSYRIEAGTYLLEFVTKSGGNRLFRDYIRVRPEYLTRGEAQDVQVSPMRFGEEPDRAVITKQPPAQLNLQEWRSGK